MQEADQSQKDESRQSLHGSSTETDVLLFEWKPSIFREDQMLETCSGSPYIQLISSLHNIGVIIKTRFWLANSVHSTSKSWLICACIHHNLIKGLKWPSRNQMFHSVYSCDHKCSWSFEACVVPVWQIVSGAVLWCCHSNGFFWQLDRAAHFCSSTSLLFILKQLHATFSWSSMWVFLCNLNNFSGNCGWNLCWSTWLWFGINRTLHFPLLYQSLNTTDIFKSLDIILYPFPDL